MAVSAQAEAIHSGIFFRARPQGWPPGLRTPEELATLVRSLIEFLKRLLEMLRLLISSTTGVLGLGFILFLYLFLVLELLDELEELLRRLPRPKPEDDGQPDPRWHPPQDPPRRRRGTCYCTIELLVTTFSGPPPNDVPLLTEPYVLTYVLGPCDPAQGDGPCNIDCMKKLVEVLIDIVLDWLSFDEAIVPVTPVLSFLGVGVTEVVIPAPRRLDRANPARHIWSDSVGECR
jgi:hypothetical protein